MFLLVTSIKLTIIRNLDKLVILNAKKNPQAQYTLGNQDLNIYEGFVDQRPADLINTLGCSFN